MKQELKKDFYQNLAVNNSEINYLVNPLHVIPQLFQVLNVTITDFTNDEPSLTLAGGLAGLEGHLLGLLGRRLRPGPGLSTSTR